MCNARVGKLELFHTLTIFKKYLIVLKCTFFKVDKKICLLRQ